MYLLVDVTSIVDGEYDENEIRKDFVTSERVAIMKAIETRALGSNQHSEGSQYIATQDEAAKRAGFGNRETARQARQTVEQAEDDTLEKHAMRERGQLGAVVNFSSSLIAVVGIRAKVRATTLLVRGRPRNSI